MTSPTYGFPFCMFLLGGNNSCFLYRVPSNLEIFNLKISHCFPFKQNTTFNSKVKCFTLNQVHGFFHINTWNRSTVKIRNILSHKIKWKWQSISRKCLSIDGNKLYTLCSKKNYPHTRKLTQSLEFLLNNFVCCYNKTEKSRSFHLPWRLVATICRICNE